VRKLISGLLAAMLLLVGVLTFQVIRDGGSLHGGNAPTAAESGIAKPTFGTTGADLSGYYAQKLTWKKCGGGFDCSTLSVPLDYANPNISAISLSVIRLATKNPIGSLILNPGGPGGSGIDYARAAEIVVSDQLRAKFSIVGFDPRGVGKSTPVHCFDDNQTDVYLAADGSPNNQTEINDMVKIDQELAAGCAKKSTELYAHVDTVSAARDVDILRQALGDKKLNWLGKSYGTFLGATYADLFPTKVGRMVLDGAIDPTLSNYELSLGQAKGFENAITRFVDDCSFASDCPLTGDTAHGMRQIQQMLDDLDSNPVKLADGRMFTQALGVYGVIAPLYDKQYGWPELRTDLTDAFAGNFETLAASVDYYTSRDANGHFTDNSNDAIAAVNCLDRPDRPTVAESQATAVKWKKIAPTFGDILAWGNLGCTYWQAPATGVAKKITAVGSPTILVVGTINDPATPYPWAVGLAKQLNKGVLLTFDGDGHTAYRAGSDCIDSAVDAYYLTGKAQAGITCNDGP